MTKKQMTDAFAKLDYDGDEKISLSEMKEFERGNLIPRGEPEGEPEIPKYLGILRVIIQM